MTTAAKGTILSSWWYISFRDALDRLTSIFSSTGDLDQDSYQVASLASNASGITDTRISVLQSYQGLSVFSALNGTFPGLLLSTIASPVPVWKVDLISLNSYELYYTSVSPLNNQTLLSKVTINLINGSVTT